MTTETSEEPKKRPLRDFLIFLWEDTKSDWEWIKEQFKKKDEAEAGIDWPPVKLEKSIPRYIWDFICEIPYIIMKNWMFFLIVTFAFSVGWLAAAKYYERLCNERIFDICPWLNFSVWPEEQTKPMLPEVNFSVIPPPINLSAEPP